MNTRVAITKFLTTNFLNILLQSLIRELTCKYVYSIFKDFIDEVHNLLLTYHRNVFENIFHRPYGIGVEYYSKSTFLDLDLQNNTFIRLYPHKVNVFIFNLFNLRNYINIELLSRQLSIKSGKLNVYYKYDKFCNIELVSTFCYVEGFEQSFFINNLVNFDICYALLTQFITRFIDRLNEGQFMLYKINYDRCSEYQIEKFKELVNKYYGSFGFEKFFTNFSKKLNEVVKEVVHLFDLIYKTYINIENVEYKKLIDVVLSNLNLTSTIIYSKVSIDKLQSVLVNTLNLNDLDKVSTLAPRFLYLTFIDDNLDNVVKMNLMFEINHDEKHVMIEVEFIQPIIDKILLLEKCYDKYIEKLVKYIHAVKLLEEYLIH